MTLAARIEHAIPIEYNGTTLSELLLQFLYGSDKATACGAEFLDEIWQSQLHKILNIENTDRFVAIKCNDRIHLRLFEFRGRIDEQGIRGYRYWVL